MCRFQLPGASGDTAGQAEPLVGQLFLEKPFHGLTLDGHRRGHRAELTVGELGRGRGRDVKANLFIYQASESSLVAAGVLAAQFLKKL